MPTNYPTRITPRGELKKLTPKQDRALDALNEQEYRWALCAPRQQCHDRAVKLLLAYDAMSPLEQMDLRGLQLKAQREGIMRAAFERGWLVEN